MGYGLYLPKVALIRRIVFTPVYTNCQLICQGQSHEPDQSHITSQYGCQSISNGQHRDVMTVCYFRLSPDLHIAASYNIHLELCSWNDDTRDEYE